MSAAGPDSTVGSFHYAVQGKNRLSRNKNYVIELDFQTNRLVFHKSSGRTREFSFASCTRLEPAGNFELNLTFGLDSGSSYRRTIVFGTTEKREEFCNIIHSVIVTGARAYKVFHAHDGDGDDWLTLDEVRQAVVEYSGAESGGKQFAFIQAQVAAAAERRKVERVAAAASNSSRVQPLELEDRAKLVHFGQFLMCVAGSQELEQERTIVPARPRQMSCADIQAHLAGMAGDESGADSDDDPNEAAIRQLRRMSGVIGAGTRRSSNVVDRDTVLLRGERDLFCKRHTSRIDHGTSRGTLIVTSYRLIYKDYQASTLETEDHSVEVPLAAVSRFEPTGKDGNRLHVHTKDRRVLKLVFDDNREYVDTLVNVLAVYAFPGDQTKLFAFSYSHHRNVGIENGWNLYDPILEYTRIQLKQHPKFRVALANGTYELCPTYPRFFVVPDAISDEDLAGVCAYRSRGRLPAVTWIHPDNQSTISRCSQPLSGVKGKRSELDEEYLKAIRLANPTNSEVLYIIDMRPFKAAMGNTIMGKGYENVSNYEKCKLRFMNIDNIHAIRHSYQSLVDLCDEESAAFAPDDSAWLSKLEGTAWLYYVRLLVVAARDVCNIMDEEGASVVTHCSDGWDRTSQVQSLVQLLLDPYFRTLRGFARLIEKEWLSFGHKFAERMGHASDDYTHEQRAPIFQHFMDSVFQIIRQFPLAFEFNDAFLVAVLDHLTDCRFGTFLFNCERERNEANLKAKTVSLWTHLLSEREVHKYVNPLFRPDNPRRLVPDCDPRRFVLWERYFLRHRRSAGACVDSAAHYTTELALRLHALENAVRVRGLDLDELYAQVTPPPPSPYADINIDFPSVRQHIKQVALRRNQNMRAHGVHNEVEVAETNKRKSKFASFSNPQGMPSPSPAPTPATAASSDEDRGSSTPQPKPAVAIKPTPGLHAAASPSPQPVPPPPSRRAPSRESSPAPGNEGAALPPPPSRPAPRRPTAKLSEAPAKNG